MRPFELREFKPIEFRNIKWLWINFKSSKFKWEGLRAGITVASPLMNLILNFKYRNYTLRLEE